MIAASDFPDIDWANEDVSRLVKIFSEKFDVMTKEKDSTIDRLAEENRQQAKKIEQLEQEIRQLRASGGKRSRKARSYNAREFKDYPRPEKCPGRRPPDTGNDESMMRVVQNIARLEYCPVCGCRLPAHGSGSDRITEDAIDGRWTKTEWEIMRRYCKKCLKQYSAIPEGVLPGEHFGTNIMSQVCCMRCLAIPHEKIEKIIYMLYGRFIAVSNIIHMCDTAADRLKPLYDGLQKQIVDAPIMSGDDTGWYYNGLHWYAWVFLTADIVLFHLSSSRSKTVSEAVLDGFEGIIIGDSHPAWNDAGDRVQRCLLHYFRNMYLTLKNNKSAEFASFFAELHKILKSSIKSWITYGEQGRTVPQRTVDSLLKRIDRLVAGSYTDKDCTRYVKRLRRERDQLFVFLTHEGVPYHNNAGERALRMFALMRKVCYGSRSRRGIQTTEIITTIYATCELRGINPCKFITGYLNGRLKSIPMPKKEQICTVAAG